MLEGGGGVGFVWGGGGQIDLQTSQFSVGEGEKKLVSPAASFCLYQDLGRYVLYVIHTFL